MSAANPSTSRYQDPAMRADDDPGVAFKKFFQSMLDGTLAFPIAGQFNIPTPDQQVFTYVGSTNNIETISYRSGGQEVALLTFTYVGGGASDDDKVASITQS
jgi:hypothetical protein